MGRGADGGALLSLRASPLLDLKNKEVKVCPSGTEGVQGKKNHSIPGDLAQTKLTLRPKYHVGREVR